MFPKWIDSTPVPLRVINWTKNQGSLGLIIRKYKCHFKLNLGAMWVARVSKTPFCSRRKEECFHVPFLYNDTRSTDTQWRHKSNISEKLGRCGRQNRLQPYLKIWDWDWIFGRSVNAIPSLGVRSPCNHTCNNNKYLGPGTFNIQIKSLNFKTSRFILGNWIFSSLTPEVLS